MMDCSSDVIDSVIILAMIAASLATMFIGAILRSSKKHWHGNPKHWNSNDE